MYRKLTILVISLWLFPFVAFADSLVWNSPSSPQTYGMNTNPTYVAAVSGTDEYVCFFNGSKSSAINGYGIGNGTDTFGNNYAPIYSNLDQAMGGAGTMSCVETDYTQSDNGSACTFNSSGTGLSDCLASAAHAAANSQTQVDYVLNSGSGGGGGTENATSSIEQSQTNLWLGYYAFFSMLVFTVWLGRNRK